MSSRRGCGSTRRRRSSTSSTEASSSSCCAGCCGLSNLPGRMPLPETLRRLLTAPGPSGYEQPAAAVFREAAGSFAEITYDSVGSTVARVKGTADGPFVAVVGHIDEIGLIVHHIDDSGFLWFTGIGGLDPGILLGPRAGGCTR